jgi:peptidoglycan/xylan/chitin deacetylase (PgdA/CDA1 family)
VIYEKGAKSYLKINYGLHPADINIVKIRFTFSASLLFLLCLLPIEGEPRDKKDTPPGVSIPILLYHRFGPVVADSMTIPTPVFESHLKYLHDGGYRVIPLRELVDRYRGGGLTSATRWVAICADDGHKTVYTDMFPLINKYRIPITLFLYPSAISNASYAMTWEQIREMKDTGLFDFQSHTYWHPNFKKEKERLKPADYEKLVEMQLKKSKETLEKKLNLKVDMLAWPFGICDGWLMTKATEAGYVAAFTIERHPTYPSDHRMALPRFLLTHADRGKAFDGIMSGYYSMTRGNHVYDQKE